MSVGHRVGLGEDLHRLVAGRELWLGGIKIPFAAGLEGHSDGDVVLHALADAILGAAACGDIGEHFPDTDEKHRGIQSREILQRAVLLARDAGLKLSNVDVVIHLERPRLGATKAKIRAHIARLLELPESRVNVKAKTAEGLGSIGNGEAIGCRAICLLEDTPSP